MIRAVVLRAGASAVLFAVSGCTSLLGIDGDYAREEMIAANDGGATDATPPQTAPDAGKKPTPVTDAQAPRSCSPHYAGSFNGEYSTSFIQSNGIAGLASGVAKALQSTLKVSGPMNFDVSPGDATIQGTWTGSISSTQVLLSSTSFTASFHGKVDCDHGTLSNVVLAGTITADVQVLGFSLGKSSTDFTGGLTGILGGGHWTASNAGDPPSQVAGSGDWTAQP